MEQEKGNNKTTSLFTRGIKSLTETISNVMFSPIYEKSEVIMNNLEKRIIRKMCSIITIGVGALFLVFALFFFLTENLGWNNPEALFSIGIIIFVSGLIIKLMEPYD